MPKDDISRYDVVSKMLPKNKFDFLNAQINYLPANWLWHNKDIFLNIFYESHQDLSLLVTFLRHI